MEFKEPRVEFVRIEKSMVTLSSTTCEGSETDYTCDDVLVADMEICNCYGSPSEVVTYISE